ncbi:MAG: NYN domain-containing protein [bacterium]
MIKHKNQRVGVFIDVQNMYYSAKALYGRKVDFGEILKAAVADRQLIRAIAYVVRATGEEDPFFEALNQRGIETKERELQEFHGGAKKADWDVGITVDAVRIGEILDVVVLVSGDGDFVELVEYLKHHGRQVEVIAFRQSASSRLVEASDDFTDLSADTDRFTIKGYVKPGRAAEREDEPEEATGSSFWIKPAEEKPARRGRPTGTGTRGHIAKNK